MLNKTNHLVQIIIKFDFFKLLLYLNLFLNSIFILEVFSGEQSFHKSVEVV